MLEGIDLGSNLDWLGAKEASASESVAEPETPVEEKPTEETPKAKEPTTPVESETPADEPPLIPLVEDLGGEDGARQLIPLVQALQDVNGTSQELGQKIEGALSKILTPDQMVDLVWAHYDKYGELMAEQYLQEHPEFAAKLGLVKAESEDQTNDDLFDDDELSPREQRLQAQVEQLNAKFAQMEQQKAATQAEQAQASQQQIVVEAEKAMFGSVVDKAFGQLVDWSDTEIQKAVRLAFAEFNQDQDAVQLYQKGVKYQQTKQDLLKASQVKASAKFGAYLAEAIEMVDAKRTKAATPAGSPIPPKRQEIDSTTRSETQPLANTNGTTNLFDKNALMRAVEERLRTKSASQG
mgnify:CR=1 FL=1